MDGLAGSFLGVLEADGDEDVSGDFFRFARWGGIGRSS